jgi:hypothetical protein
MATYTGYLKLASGRVVTMHFASSVPDGTLLPVRSDGATAVSTDNTYFVLPKDDMIVDFVTDQTAGMAMIIANGVETGYTLLTTAANAPTVSNRQVPPAKLRAGVIYNIKKKGTGAA